MASINGSLTVGKSCSVLLRTLSLTGKGDIKSYLDSSLYSAIFGTVFYRGIYMEGELSSCLRARVFVIFVLMLNLKEA